jgi:1,4-alpha-glucan branching enzyme
LIRIDSHRHRRRWPFFALAAAKARALGASVSGSPLPSAAGQHQRPFFFFTDFPEALGQAVHEGRLRIFHERPPAGAEPQDAAPGCQHIEAFQQSKLAWDEHHSPPHRDYLEFFREALALRRQLLPHLSARLEDTKVEQKGTQWLIELKAATPEEPPALLAANLDRQSSLCIDKRHAILRYATQPLSTTPQITLPPKTTALFRLGS